MAIRLVRAKGECEGEGVSVRRDECEEGVWEGMSVRKGECEEGGEGGGGM